MSLRWLFVCRKVETKYNWLRTVGLLQPEGFEKDCSQNKGNWIRTGLLTILLTSPPLCKTIILPSHQRMTERMEENSEVISIYISSEKRLDVAYTRFCGNWRNMSRKWLIFNAFYGSLFSQKYFCGLGCFRRNRGVDWHFM